MQNRSEIRTYVVRWFALTITYNMCNLIIKNVMLPAVSFAFLVLGISNAAAWQDDPFDPFGSNDPDAPVVTDTSGATGGDDEEPDQSLSDGVKLVIRAVRESNPTTPIELGRAIKSMINIEQFNEAKKYLAQLNGLNLKGPEIFDLSETLGADFLIDLKIIPELQPEGATFAAQAFQTAKQEAYAPERIAQLISELSDENKFVRNDAFRKLRLLGAPAVAVMLEVCENEKRRKEVPFLQSALKQMGEPALLPLIGAVRADGTVAQAVAVGALSSINSPLAHDALLRASLSSYVPPSVRAIASSAVSTKGPANQDSIKTAIFNRANKYLDGQVDIPSDGRGMSTIWNWDFRSGKLIATTTNEANAIRIMAVDLARDVFRLEPGNNKYRQLQLLTVAEATKRVLGPNRFILIDEVKGFIPDLNSDDLNLAISTAIERDLTPAAVGTAELMGQMGDPAVLLTDSGNSPLVQAVISGNRELQYAACKAISQIDPKQAFPGCSYVGKIATLMAATDGRSTGVAVHPRTDVAQALASSVFQAGSIGLTVNSGEQLFEVLNVNPDIDFIMVTDSLSRPHYQEVVQQLRSYWLSKTLPIALLVRDTQRERQAELIFDRDPMTIVLPLTSNPKLVFTQVQRLRSLRKNVVSDAQRNQHADFAMNWISQLLSDPVYRFYHLGAYKSQLEGLVKVPGNYDVKSQILSKLGTPVSQATLANLASDKTVPLSDRLIVANAFAASVQQFGILLSSAEIQAQYDRYNASESQPVEVQRILGSMLDAIEAKAKSNQLQVSAK